MKRELQRSCRAGAVCCCLSAQRRWPLLPAVVDAARLLKHRANLEGLRHPCASQLAAPSFLGADSFYVRVNLDIDPSGDVPFLGAAVMTSRT
ncbi:unnamed protein product [Arctogadus glacialis]